MVEQLRVGDLAKTMGISPTELVFKLRSIGVSVSGEDDTLDLSTVRSIITGETLQKRPRQVILRRDQGEKQESPKKTARDRLVRRRRVIKTDEEISEVPEPDHDEEEMEAPEEPAAETAAGTTETEVVASVEEPESGVAEGEPEETEEVGEAPEVEVDEAVEEEAEAPVAAEVEESPAEEVGEDDTVAAEPAAVEEPEGPAAEAEQQPQADEAAPERPEASTEETEEDEVKPAPEVSEEELTAEREEPEEAPKRVMAKRAKTPLERGLRELSQEEIKERVKARKKAPAAKKEKAAKSPRSRKAKAAADAREIKDLLNKFEEQKVKSQPEGGDAASGRGRQAPAAAANRKAKRKRRRRTDDRPTAPPKPRAKLQFKDGEKPEGPVILTEMVTPKELADKLNVMVKDLLAVLIGKGMMVTANQSLPHEVAEEICEELEVEAMVASVEDVLEFEREEAEQVSGPQEPRAPVVTVMGHVDHGKTSLLDAIRSSRVAESEAGGITQHIGASRIQKEDGRSVVFIDTPGHEAFTQMRSRGAQVTDIVALVVAADDGVMPQTIEAIDHARAAGVPLVVAINKIDKPNANVDVVKQALAQREVLVEDWGGDVPSVEVSAKTGQGIEDLLELMLLVAEMHELTSTAEGLARGVVLEARKEKGRGTVATVLVQQGVLSVGNYFFCGSTWGRVRAMIDDAGERVDEAGPSDPVEVMGFVDVPEAGDVLHGVEDEDEAQRVAGYRREREKEEALAGGRKASLESFFEQMEQADTKELNIVLKGDVQGSVEVLRDTLQKLSTDKVSINVLHGSVGAVTTNDVMLASASEAIVIGFNVRPERTARELADEEQIDLRLYTVIYELVDDVKKAMVGLLEPVYREEELGDAEVRQVFRVPKVGAVAGCFVTSGTIHRNAKVRLLRDNVVVHQGTINSLKRFKDDATEVREGFECGIGLEGYQDIKVGDVIEAYRIVEVAPEL